VVAANNAESSAPLFASGLCDFASLRLAHLLCGPLRPASGGSCQERCTLENFSHLSLREAFAFGGSLSRNKINNAAAQRKQRAKGSPQIWGWSIGDARNSTIELLASRRVEIFFEKADSQVVPEVQVPRRQISSTTVCVASTIGSYEFQMGRRWVQSPVGGSPVHPLPMPKGLPLDHLLAKHDTRFQLVYTSRTVKFNRHPVD